MTMITVIIDCTFTIILCLSWHKSTKVNARFYFHSYDLYFIFYVYIL